MIKFQDILEFLENKEPLLKEKIQENFSSDISRALSDCYRMKLIDMNSGSHHYWLSEKGYSYLTTYKTERILKEFSDEVRKYRIENEKNSKLVAKMTATAIGIAGLQFLLAIVEFVWFKNG